MAEETVIPTLVKESERIVRIIYSPKHTKSEKGKIALKYQTFRSPPNKDEVSVTRLEHSSANFCKQYGKEHENVEDKRKYFGLAILRASEIREFEAEIISTPQPDNLAHADIMIGYVCEVGKELPSEMRFKVDQMNESARIYPDADIDALEWNSGNLE